MTKEELERLDKGQNLVYDIGNMNADIADIDEFIAKMSDIDDADIRIFCKDDTHHFVRIDDEFLLQVLNVIKEGKQRRLKELQKQFDEL